MTSFETERRKARGITKADAGLRRAAVNERARNCLTTLMDGLKEQDSDFVVEVMRALVRAIGGALVQRAGEGRAVGIVVGVLVNISPAWRTSSDAAHEAAAALFRDEAA